MVRSRFLIALLAASLVTLLLAAAVSAGTPRGQGLSSPLEQGFTALDCGDADIGIEDVIFPRGGGGATWTTDGRMYLVQRVEGDVTITLPDSTVIHDSFAQTYGRKTGLAERITCSFAIFGEENGVTFEAEGTVVLARVR
jgi:hypothetical protein